MLASVVLCLVGPAVFSSRVSAQDAIQRIEREYNAGEENRRLTVVTFRSRNNLSLSSNLIRLGDVVEPVDPDLPGWSQVSRLGIGLVPVDGTEMLIERVRLEPFINGGQKRPLLIRWIGPSKMRVCCQLGQDALMQNPTKMGAAITATAGRHHKTVAGNPSSSEILRASAVSPIDPGIGEAATKSQHVHAIANIDPQYLFKVRRWIFKALSSAGSAELEQYDFRLVEVEKIRPTKRNLDLAILGTGFLQVVDPTSGKRVCVPAGRLEIGVNDELVLVNDRLIMPLYPALTIPRNTASLRVNSDGGVEVIKDTAEEWVLVGKIGVSTNGHPADQASESESVSLASAIGTKAEMPVAKGSGSWQILQGFLESTSVEAYRDFESLSGVDTVTGLHSLREGVCKFRVQGRGNDGPVDLVVSLDLSAKPMVAAPRNSFPRGHRLALQDLHLIPIEVGQVDNKQFVSLQQLVGMEVSKSLRVNRPILHTDVRQPTLVRRGDLLDLRVVGAGIVVTTAAKALGDAPLNELVEVETMRPRKRRIARVVSAGVVEILSRPPQVGNLLESRRK
jgi:flagella basal body P-ring formation protein FlgA